MTEVVLVTGANGCLGQHIVRLLQEKDDSVKEIRLFDLVAYENKLGHATPKVMKTIVGDVRKLSDLLDAFQGVDCVIHAAAVVDITMFPDEKLLQETNVAGTRNVISACVQRNVIRLVYTSTVDMMYGGEHIFYGMESTTVEPKSKSLGVYAETKAQGEHAILKASGQMLDNGTDRLRSLAIRPTIVYGEEDHHFVPFMLRMAKVWSKGTLMRVHSLDERLQVTYAGNAAWAHIKAKERLIHDNTISGEAFYVTDDTPIVDIYENIRPYVEASKHKMSERVLPYWFVYFALVFLSLFLRLVRPIYKMSKPLVPSGVVSYMCSTIFFNRSKAILRLNYQPIYTHEEAQTNSLKYYSKLKI